MNPFKILQIRKNIRDARANPSGFVGKQTREIFWGTALIPIIISILGLVLFFIIGYTDLFGFHLGFFKFLFWLGLIVSFISFSLTRRIIRFTSDITSKQTRRVVEAIVVESENK